MKLTTPDELTGVAQLRGRGVWFAGTLALATTLVARPTVAGEAVAEQVLRRDEEMAQAVVAADLTRLEYVGVWVRRNGRWRIVLTQATRIAS